MWTIIKAAGNWVGEMLLPTQCLGCRTYGASLCDPCLASIERQQEQQCIVCQHPSPNGTTCPVCRSSITADRLFACGPYTSQLLIHAIQALKYKSHMACATPLAHWTSEILLNHAYIATDAILTPVPLHPSRQRERGFNQAELLTKQIAHELGLEYQANILIRRSNTASQVTSGTRAKRIENMRDAFSTHADTNIRGRTVVVLDDVCTTGATLNACAAALKTAGAGTVIAIALVRG